ncbi:DMP19 family protein [Spirosoma aureum]|uniref:DMP19 family protein n=1 Tax=Spirosoma aureum TaxID=2692134 RepID=A0A6G9ASQ6_9BACT|nr:DUF4375 domain-containing protein [Spirosoma aureum]QIP15243.1 DMP19 family protein [Spirosoma aureum]
MKKQDQTLIDFQDDWGKLVDKAFTNYLSLSPDERIWFNIEALIGDVDNGGLISHYYNSGADYNKQTIEDLYSLGFPAIAALLMQMNSLFPDGQPSTDIDERNEVIDNWPEGEYDALSQELDQQFYSMEAELESKLVQHIQTKLRLVDS